MRPSTGIRHMSVDAVVAVALTAASQLEIWTPALIPGVGEVAGSRPLLSLTSIAMTAPLAIRRYAPVLVLAIVLTAACMQSLFTTPTEGLSTLAALLLAAYSVSAYSRWRGASAGALLLIVAVTIIGENSGDRAFLAVVLGAAWVMGYVVAQRSNEVTRLISHNEDLALRLASATAALAAETSASAAVTSSPDHVAGLTPREIEVVRAIASGRSNAEIASLLVISEWTVKTHVASVLRKLGLRDRAQVVVAAYESRLVTPAGPDD